MIELAHLLDQHLAAHNLRPCWPDGTGSLAFETPDLVAFCAYRNSQGGLGQFANPGYLHEAQWAAAIEDEEPGEEGPGLLMSWKTKARHGAWSSTARPASSCSRARFRRCRATFRR